jgi:hypothetical protein
MAITTQDGIVGGTKGAGFIFKSSGQPVTAANNWHSYWASNAIPSAGSFSVSNTTTGVIPDEATTGAMPFTDPTGGQISYIMGAAVTATVSGTVWLYDRCFHIGSFTPTSGAIAGVTGTALDRPADGVGTLIFAEINSTLSAAAHTVTITYTNQNGDTGRTATVVLAASAPAGRVFFATLQAGDSGVRQITAVSGSATPPTGSYNLVIARPLLIAGCVANVPRSLGVPESGLRPLYANTCAAVLVYNPSGTTATTVQASLDLVTG